MATNNSTSLYSFNSNVKVSPNNFTTLYNSQPGTIVTADVADRNFTTLYTEQTATTPTKPYGNANVEAFLNAGFDAGGNTVENIHMANSLYVGGSSYLGSVLNVHIDGGSLNYVLSTDGAGNLNWAAQTIGDGIPYIHFDVTTTANNQQFTDVLLTDYGSNVEFNVMKNGVNIEPSLYEKINPTTLQVNILLNNGDTIDVLAGGSGSGAGGNVYEIQYNGGGFLEGNSSFTFDQVNSLMTVGNIVVNNINTDTFFANSTVNLGDIANVYIGGGAAGYTMQTDGAGNLTWVTPISGGNANVAGSNTQIQYNDGINLGASANLTFNVSTNTLTVTNITANGAGLTSLTGANVTGVVANATYAITSGSATTAGYAVTANTANIANTANTANIANSVSGSNVSGNVPTAVYAYSVDVANVTGIGNIATINLDGNSLSYLDGTGTWTSVTATNANYANYAGNVTMSAQPNITSLGTLLDLTVSGNLTVQRGFEPFTISGVAATGTINFDVINQSILYYNVNASGNCTVNVRGNSTVSLNSLLPINDAMTIVFLNTVGSPAYINSTLTIDGIAQTVNWASNISPSSGTRLTSAKQSYTYTIMKTGSATYTVLGALTEFK